MIQVVPAIIPNNEEQLREEISKVSHFASLIQIDISDGVFTPFTTWPYNGKDPQFHKNLLTQEVGWPNWEDSEFEVHLMVKLPETVLENWIESGVSGVIAHIEATDNFQKIIDICRERSVNVGIAIKPSTDISKIEDFVDKVDFIQVMGSDQLGKHGTVLEEKALEMIKSLRREYPERIIAIDIGVTEETAEDLVSAGANKLISGSAILDSVNPKEVFDFFASLK